MWRLQHTKKKLGQKQSKKGDTVLEGFTIISLTGKVIKIEYKRILTFLHPPSVASFTYSCVCLCTLFFFLTRSWIHVAPVTSLSACPVSWSGPFKNWMWKWEWLAVSRWFPSIAHCQPRCLSFPLLLSFPLFVCLFGLVFTWIEWWVLIFLFLHLLSSLARTRVGKQDSRKSHFFCIFVWLAKSGKIFILNQQV